VDIGLRLHAVNTAADSENKIHDDNVAASFGFRGGLVPGVTVYGYLAHAAADHFGLDWLQRGAMDVRFEQPVYDGDDVVVHLHAGNDNHVVAEIAERASGVAWIHGEPPPDLNRYQECSLDRCPPASRETLAPGVTLGTLIKRLDLSQSRMSAPLDPAIGPERLAHPAVLLALANEVLVRNVILGPWIHVASEVRKFNAVRDGEDICVLARVEDRYERKGHEFVVLDVLIVAGGGRIAEQVRHTAIWRPRQKITQPPASCE
jgi:hypothetical protein